MEKHTTIFRWGILKKVIDGNMSLRDASLELEVSYRQAIRMKKAVVDKGVRGLIHGNTGRKPGNALSKSVRAKIEELSKNEYATLNDTCFSELIKKEYDINVSRESVRQIRRSQNISSLNIRKKQRITLSGSKGREGMCFFWDCIISKWFPEAEYSFCLFAAIDDVSGRCISARFFPFEESAVYLWALQNVVKTSGIPKQIIQDKNPLLKRNDSDWSIEEQLRGEAEPTQIGKAMEALGVQPVFVNTSRQKKYFERIFEQLNICLVEELSQHNIKDINDGNLFLEERFINDFNESYALTNNTAENYCQESVSSFDLERLCSFRYDVEVSKSNRVNIGNIFIPLNEAYDQHLFRTKNLEVRQLLDGSWRVYCDDIVVGKHQSTPLLEPVRTMVRPKRNTTRAPQCAWVYPENKM